MRLGSILILITVVLATSSCMKKTKIGDIRTRSTVLDPEDLNITGLCSNGSLTASPRGGTPGANGYPTFETNSWVYFDIVGSGCNPGFILNDGSNPQRFRTRPSIAPRRKYNSATEATVETFSVSVRDSAGNPVGEVSVESSPFNVVAATPPQCEIEPSKAFREPGGIVRVKFTPTDSGKLTSIAPQSGQTITISSGGIAPALPSGGRDIVGNRTYDYTLTTSEDSGTILFRYTKTVAAGLTPPEGSCPVEVIPSLCNSGVQADFLGTGSNQDLRISCSTNAGPSPLLVTPLNGGSTYGFGNLSIDQATNIRQLMAGKISDDNKADLLILKKVANDEGSFILGLNTSGSGFSSIAACTGSWKLAGQNLPSQFSFEEKGTNPAKVVALIGSDASAVRYEATVQVSGSSCSIGQPAPASRSLNISADRTVVPHEQSAQITWSAANVGAGTLCSLKRKLTALPDTNSQGASNWSDITGETNINSQQVVSRTVSSGPLTESTDFQAICVNSGNPSLNDSKKVTIRVDNLTYPLQVRDSLLSGSAAISFFQPEIPAGKNIADYTGRDLYVSWNRSDAASGCRLFKTPLGGTETSDSVERVSGSPRTTKVDRTTTFSLRCSGVDDIAKTVYMGGAPEIKAGTAASASWSNVAKNSTPDARALVISASGRGAKIKVQTVSIARESGSGTFAVNDGCNNHVLNPVSTDQCTVSVTYAPAGHNTRKSAVLEVAYQRYNDAGVLLDAVYRDYIGSISGSVAGSRSGGK